MNMEVYAIMKKRFLVVGLVCCFFCTVMQVGATSGASKVSTQTSGGIMQTSDGSIIIDTADITNIRTALNDNATLLDSVVSAEMTMISHKVNGIESPYSLGDTRISCVYTAGDGNTTQNHLKITLN